MNGADFVPPARHPTLRSSRSFGMIFSSFIFIFVFLPLAVGGYYLFGRKSVKSANRWLLAASFFFYGWWNIGFLPLMLILIVCNYAIGLALHRFRYKKALLVLGIGTNLAVLGYYKYTDFFIQTINRILHTGWSLHNIILPLGISFYTFQALSYIIDVYMQKTQPEKSFSAFALYISLFPQLIAGPIVDHKMMIPQFASKERHRFNAQNFSSGITLFAFGVFKKVVIADRLSPVVADVFGHISTLTFTDAWIGVLSYALQLYFDFSAYSEMAIGLGNMLNLTFPSNFDSPYQACSMIDFWRRWHISLGSWIRNYIYIPLGGNRNGERRKMINLLIAMTLCGLWHGAGFKYIAWGMLHGTFLVVNHRWRRFAKRHDMHMPKIAGWAMTFGATCIGWALFRAPSLRSGISLVKTMLNLHKLSLPAGGKVENLLAFLQYFGVPFAKYPDYPYGLLMALLVVVFCVPSAERLVAAHFRASWKWLCASSAALAYSLYLLAVNQNLSEFLYFQF